MIKAVIASLVLLCGKGFAQESRFDKASIDISISATVISYLEMITLSDIDVGTVQPSQIEVRLNPRLDQGAGLIKIKGRRTA